MNIVKEFQHKGKTVRICVDPDPQSPAEWDNLGEILYSSSRYCLGTRNVSREELASTARRSDIIALPVKAYVHSGASITADPVQVCRYPFNCPWDGGQSGYVFVTLDKVREEYKVKRVSAKLREKVTRVLIQEVETFAEYLRGEVYGYTIENPDGSDKDSCWGFYGLDYCEQSAREAC